MSKVEIKTSKLHRYGKGCIIGGTHIHFDEIGVAEVEQAQIDELFAKDDSLSLVGKEGLKEEKTSKKVSGIDTKQVEELKDIVVQRDKEITLLKERIVGLEREVDALKNPDNYLKESSEPLDNKVEENPFLTTSLEDCRDLCKSAGYPELKWQKMKEKSIREYLFEQYKNEQLGKAE